MHSNPLRPSQKNSCCSKLQRMRDMYDPYGKNPVLGAYTEAKKCVARGQCAKNAAQRPKRNANPWSYQKKMFIA